MRMLQCALIDNIAGLRFLATLFCTFCYYKWR